jgi:hypothetical protein
MSEGLTHSGLYHRWHHACAVARLEALVRALVGCEEGAQAISTDDGLLFCALCGGRQKWPEGGERGAHWYIDHDRDCPYGVLDGFLLRDALKSSEAGTNGVPESVADPVSKAEVRGDEVTGEALGRAKVKIAEISGGTGWPLIMPEDARALSAEVARLETQVTTLTEQLRQCREVREALRKAGAAVYREQREITEFYLSIMNEAFAMDTSEIGAFTVQQVRNARLGALVRRLPELGSVPGSYERVGLCCEGQWSWKTERSNILSTAFSPSHETPDEALAAALGVDLSPRDEAEIVMRALRNSDEEKDD